MAEERQVPRWFAFDGTDYPTRAECEEYEETHFQRALVGLTAEQVAAALERDPKVRGVSDALERAGTLVARARLKAGERKRAPAGSKAALSGDDQSITSDSPTSPATIGRDPDELP